MNELSIKRISHDDLIGTFGVLRWLDRPAPFALSCELPDKNNAVGESCIPHGRYKCAAVLSPRFGPTFEIINVQGRTNILFHKGNTVSDTEGCILVGEQFEFLNGVASVAASGKGFGEFFERATLLDEFMLNIQWAL